VVHDEESSWRPSVRSSIRYFRVWRPVPFGRTGWGHFRPGVVLASALYGVGNDTKYINVSNPSNRPGLQSPGGEVRRRLVDEGGVLSRVNGSYVSGYRFGRVPFS
jgi:hypothetical protein